MCGIHLIVRKTEAQIDCSLALQQMISASGHRGPDGSGYKVLQWSAEQIWIGHNLLSISDNPDLSRQPMETADGTCGIIFNGQICNHLEIRSMLRSAGVEFRSDSDTETLLYWLRQYGRKGLRQLRGMYAFVFWDSAKELLIMHRDGYGIKPFYYSRSRHYFIASSEPEAIIKSGLMPFAIDKQAIAYFLKYKFIPAPQSPWVGIKSLLPGEVVEYWESKPLHYIVQDVPRFPDISSLEEALDVGFAEVIAAREPVALMLSGGIDSTLILTWCLKNGVEVVPYAIRFDPGLGGSNPDQQAVEFLIQKFQIQVRWVEVGLAEMNELWNLPKRGSVLVADSAWILTACIARRCKLDGIRIVLSGAGADEWFGGYRRHWYYHQWEKLNRFVPEKWQASLLRKMGNARSGALPKTDSVATLVWDYAVSGKLSTILRKEPFLSTGHKPDMGSNLPAALIWDQKQYLPNDVLLITDMATMAFGVEGRFPFLHPAITGFADRFSAEVHLKTGRKWMLTELLRPVLGRAFVERKKRGFGLPLSAFWLQPENSDRVRQLVMRNQENLSQWFAPDELAKFLQKWKPEVMPQETLTLLLLSLWMEQHP